MILEFHSPKHTFFNYSLVDFPIFKINFRTFPFLITLAVFLIYKLPTKSPCSALTTFKCHSMTLCLLSPLPHPQQNPGPRSHLLGRPSGLHSISNSLIHAVLLYTLAKQNLYTRKKKLQLADVRNGLNDTWYASFSLCNCCLFINKWLVEIIFYQKKTLHLHGVL